MVPEGLAGLETETLRLKIKPSEPDCVAGLVLGAVTKDVVEYLFDFDILERGVNFVTFTPRLEEPDAELELELDLELELELEAY